MSAFEWLGSFPCEKTAQALVLSKQIYSNATAGRNGVLLLILALSDLCFIESSTQTIS